jgi:hypothetical protein
MSIQVHIVTTDDGEPTLVTTDEKKAWDRYNAIIKEACDHEDDILDEQPEEDSNDFVEIEGKWYRLADQYGTAHARIFGPLDVE